MKSILVSGLVITAAVLGLTTSAFAQGREWRPAGKETEAAFDSTALAEDPPESKSTGVHYQTGMFLQFAGDPLLRGDQKWLATLDLSFSSFNRTRSAWGFGLHLAVDEATARFGPKVLWRTPLSAGGRGYFQVSPGIYLVGDDDLKWSSGFLEAELGYSNNIALVVAVEHLDYGSSNNGTGEDYSRTAGYVGLKLGQTPALVATAGLLAWGIAAVSSMDFD